MVIRSVTNADAAEWARLRSQLWPSHDAHAGDIQGFLAGSMPTIGHVLLAIDDDGHAMGFAEMSIRPYAEGCYPGRVAFLEGWFVEPAARGRGVGAALVRGVEDWGRVQGCTELGSDTTIDNAGSAAAHRALGFDEVERIICFRKAL
jgi:aminoglycoside 6'-N-acetyltransferase I